MRMSLVRVQLREPVIACRRIATHRPDGQWKHGGQSASAARSSGEARSPRGRVEIPWPAQAKRGVVHAGIAQLIEQPPCKGKVLGLNPSSGTSWIDAPVESVQLREARQAGEASQEDSRTPNAALAQG